MCLFATLGIHPNPMRPTPSCAVAQVGSFLDVQCDRLERRKPNKMDPCAMHEHFYHIFDTWPVVRPGTKEFFEAIAKAKEAGSVKRVYIYTANTSLPWVRFVMQCVLKYCGFQLDLIDGIKHAPGGLKVVPEHAVLYDDHSGNAIGRCVQVEPYTNEIPWCILEPLISMLPDHGPNVCPCWEQCGGIQAFIARDKSYTDRDHDPASDGTMFALAEEFVPYEEVLLDMDETLLAGARISAYFNALNHFLLYQETEEGMRELEKSKRQQEKTSPTLKAVSSPPVPRRGSLNLKTPDTSKLSQDSLSSGHTNVAR